MKTKGFTLIEVLIAVTVMGILMAIAVPSFNALLSSNQATTQTNEFITALNYTRSEAIKRGASVYMVALSTAPSNNEWGSSWQICLNNTCSSGNVLKKYAALSGNSRLDSQSTIRRYKFNSQGFIDTADTLTWCQASGQAGKTIDISATGRAHVQDTVC